MNKDEYIIQQQREEIESEYAFDELMDSQMEDLKIEYHNNLVLLQKLLEEVTSQINTKNPDLIKIKGMINET